MLTLRKLALIYFLITVSGCAAASAGKYFEINDANRVKNGMTREEVIVIMEVHGVKGLAIMQFLRGEEVSGINVDA